MFFNDEVFQTYFFSVVKALRSFGTPLSCGDRQEEHIGFLALTTLHFEFCEERPRAALGADVMMSLGVFDGMGGIRGQSGKLKVGTMYRRLECSVDGTLEDGDFLLRDTCWIGTG